MLKDSTLEEIVRLVRQQIDFRLAKSSVSGEDEPFSLALDAEERDAEEESEDEEEATDDPNAEEDEIELGRSLLGKLRDKLEDVAWCEKNIEALRDIAKPATIIDGQHRVKGAEACERGIPFTVCALFDCEWSEQVFQFTVVNYTQKGIPDQFITANAALSLTSNELATLRDRLVQARVQVVEYELMKVVQFDPASPFFELVNLGERAQSGRIGYKTMVRISKKWYGGLTPDIKRLLFPNLFPEAKGKGAQASRMQQWKDDVWADFFNDFWTVVKDRYSRELTTDGTHSLWDVGHSNLMIAIVLPTSRSNSSRIWLNRMRSISAFLRVKIQLRKCAPSSGSGQPRLWSGSLPSSLPQVGQ